MHWEEEVPEWVYTFYKCNIMYVVLLPENIKNMQMSF